MPQTTYLPMYTASYPLLCKVQKPGGVTVSSVLIATAVPNKFQPFTSTIQMTQQLNPEELGEAVTTENPETEEEQE